jgi:hypothetical protein
VLVDLCTLLIKVPFFIRAEEIFTEELCIRLEGIPLNYVLSRL